MVKIYSILWKYFNNNKKKKTIIYISWVFFFFFFLKNGFSPEFFQETFFEESSSSEDFSDFQTESFLFDHSIFNNDVNQIIRRIECKFSRIIKRKKYYGYDQLKDLKFILTN